MDQDTISRSENPNLGKDFVFTRRDVVTHNDFNTNGQYPSGLVQFDTRQTTNQSESYTDWGQSRLVLPLVLQLNASGGLQFTANGIENAWSASLKSLSTNLVHSVSVKLGSEVVPVVAFNNLHCNYEFLTQATLDDVKNIGPSMLFAKDTSESQYWHEKTGSTNNTIKDIAFTCALTGAKFVNKGRRQRMLMTAVDWDIANSPDTIQKELLPTQPTLNISYKSYMTESTASRITFFITAEIELRYLHSYFREQPVAKNTIYEIAIQTNTPATVTCNYSASQVLTGCSSIVTSGGTNCIQLSPLGIAGTTTGTGLNCAATSAVGAIVGTLNICRGASGSFNHPITSAQLRLSQGIMTPEKEQEYLASPVKSFVYQKLFNPSSSLAVATGSTVDVVLTQGMANLRKLIIYPFISAASNGVTGLPSQNSPFASEPLTMGCHASYVTNFNVLVNNINLFRSPLNARSDFYLNELRPNSTIMGGSEFMSNGLLSEYDMNTAYGYIVIDLSRGVRAMDSAAKSIRVQFVNSSKFTIDYYYHLVSDVACSINVEQGQIVI